MKPNARELTEIIVQTLRTSGESLNYQSEIIRILCTRYKLSPAVAAEHAEKLFTPVQAHLHKIHLSQKERGLTPEFQVSEYDFRFLVPIETLRPGHQLLRTKVLNALRASTWDTFESACCRLLELSKCTKSGVGHGTKEGGLDFYALMHIATLAPQKKMLFDWRVRVFGQAKHWGRKVAENELRIFNDQITEFASRQTGTAYRKAPEWFRLDKSPVLGVFVGLDGFTKGALGVAQRNGILTRDGEQIAEFFADAIEAGEIRLTEL